MSGITFKDFEVKSDFVFIKAIQFFQLFCNNAYEILLFNGMVYFHKLKETFNNFVLGSCFLFYLSSLSLIGLLGKLHVFMIVHDYVFIVLLLGN